MRASSQLGSTFGGYNLLSNNCEHFAYWCVTGIRQSRQTLNINSADDKRDIVEKAIDMVFEPIMLVGKVIDKKLGLENEVEGDRKDIVENTIDTIFNPIIKFSSYLDKIFKI